MRLMLVLLSLVAIVFGYNASLPLSEDNMYSVMDDVGPQYNCKMFTDVNTGHLYNLNGLANGGEGYSLDPNGGISPPGTPGAPGFFYRFAVCETFNSRYEVNYCNDPAAAVCKTQSADRTATSNVLAKVTNMTDPFIPLVGAEGLTQVLTAPADGACPNGYITKIDFICNTGVMYPTFAAKDLSDPCNPYFTCNTHHACKRNRCPVYTTVRGYIDLSPLQALAPYGYNVPGVVGIAMNNSFVVSLCGALPPSMGSSVGDVLCTEPGNSACEYWNGTMATKNFKILGLSQLVTVGAIPGDSDSNPTGVLLTMTGGDHSFTCAGAHSALVTVKCDPSIAASTPPVITVTGRTGCVTSFQTSHSAACLVSTNGIGIYIGNTYLSGGSVFLILLFVCLSVYFIVGCLVNRFARKKTGREIVPHVDFWTSIPGYTWEGIRFCISCCGRRGGGRTTKYDSM